MKASRQRRRRHSPRAYQTMRHLAVLLSSPYTSGKAVGAIQKALAAFTKEAGVDVFTPAIAVAAYKAALDAWCERRENFRDYEPRTGEADNREEELRERHIDFLNSLDKAVRGDTPGARSRARRQAQPDQLPNDEDMAMLQGAAAIVGVEGVHEIIELTRMGFPQTRVLRRALDRKAKTPVAGVAPDGAVDILDWAQSHPRPIRRLIFAEKETETE
jgi:hypothetical protein